MPTGAELFVDALLKLEIRELFTLVGDHLNDVLPVAAQRGMRIVDMRHESGVTHAADAWARIHRRPAVSLVTGGPGHTNSLTGIATAHLACSPLIAVSGGRASTLGERGAFQDIDQVGMAKPVVKWAAQPPGAAQIPFYLHRAYEEANTGRKGAVHLTIPVDVFAATAPEGQLWRPIMQPVTRPDSLVVNEAIGILKAAERPVVIAGSGVWWGDAAAELQAFLELTQLPLFTITMARGVVPDGHPLCFGYADPSLNRAAHDALRSADVVLVLGKRIDYRMAMGGPRLFAPGAKFLQADIHGPEFGVNRELEVALHGDLKATLGDLRAKAGEEPWPKRPWLGHLAETRTAWQTRLAEAATDCGTPLHPAAFFTELRRWLPAGAIYSWDGGDFVHWGRAILTANGPGRWMRLGPLATIGSALPNAIALKMAHPRQPVVLFTGDGSLGFYIAEIDTAVRHGIPVIIVVGNDGGWGLERELQSEALGSTVACELRQSRYDIVTRGFGGAGETIERVEQIGPAFERALASTVPYCLNVLIRGKRSPFTEWQVEGKKRA